MAKPPPTAAGKPATNSLPKEGSFAWKQMIKMGWKPDTGLGKDGGGITTAIKVSKRRDGEAIGGGGDMGHKVSVRSYNSSLSLFLLLFILLS